MATTTLTLISNRYGSDTFLQGDTTTVAVDASVAENYILPPGFGGLLMYHVFAQIDTFSAAYVAPTPPFDGFLIRVADPAGAVCDIVGARRFVHFGTGSARPQMITELQLLRPVLLRKVESVVLLLPIVAGAGATASVRFGVRGLRIMTA